MKFAEKSFTNIIDDLLLQLPILIKLKVQVPMSLFSIETAPVPLDAETYLGEKREYIQIIQETELIALTENNYIPLTQAQILLCAKIGYMYYCEYAHLLKKCMEHTCMSAIYYDQGSDIKAKQCKTIVNFGQFCMNLVCVVYTVPECEKIFNVPGGRQKVH